MQTIFLYGPPGSGKSTLGHILSDRLGLPFIDLDKRIEVRKGMSVRAFFAAEGETAFRACEREVLREICLHGTGIVSLGGGTLLDAENRALAEKAGRILCLDVDEEILLNRVSRSAGSRPLASTRETAQRLLAERAAHYASFPLRLTAGRQSVNDLCDAAQMLLGSYRVSGMGNSYAIHIRNGLLEETPFSGGTPHTVIVGDSHTLPLYGKRVLDMMSRCGCRDIRCVEIPAGEATKTIATIGSIWSAFSASLVERRDCVVALGGGVVGDLTGFAASAWLRGVSWIGIPTTLLSMVDSSLGGKTGADLPEGKNLIGAFHPPVLVLDDPDTLASLPTEELRCGMAEAIKHAIIGDPGLLESLPAFEDFRNKSPCVSLFLARAMGVKIRHIQKDPFEKGIRAALNLGHTIGHGIEKASRYTIKHGEGVAIGTVLETRLSEAMGLAPAGLADTIANAFRSVGLPVSLPSGIDLEIIRKAMTHDKKKADGQVRFALPVALGDVRTGIVVPDAILLSVLQNSH